VPALVTVSAKDDCTKLAVTEVAAVTVTVQVPVQPPLQPVKVEPAAAAAVNVTDVPFGCRESAAGALSRGRATRLPSRRRRAARVSAGS